MRTRVMSVTSTTGCALDVEPVAAGKSAPWSTKRAVTIPVAEIPAIPGCYVPMTSREATLAELAKFFALIAEQFRQKGQQLPAETTEIINA